MFVDRVEIEVEGGRGGSGCMSFRRERYVPRGGPDGGDGGAGGSVIIRAEQGVNSLVALAHRRSWKAVRGQHGQGSNRHGRCGEDLIVEVPPGTVVMDARAGLTIKDLIEPGDSFVAARGGKGGKGNVRFKSSTNQVPREHTPGDEGERRLLKLELKVIADVGLLGMPNAGKSTLLSRMSRARPEVADYPFTTKFPILGQVTIDFDHSFVMADIPGLIEGAHQGIGLGHEFLRHIERAGVLVHLVEPLPMDGSNPIENYRGICEELIRYNPQLGQRPQLVVVSKGELPGADQVRDELELASGGPVRVISAVTGQGLDLLKRDVVRLLEQVATP